MTAPPASDNPGDGNGGAEGCPPVDILTRLAIDHLKYDPTRTIGLGTQLDTARFRSLIATETSLPPSQIKALILGEHGDSMVPIWSSATAAGISLLKFPNFNTAMQQKVFEPGRTLGWDELTKHATGESLNAKAFAADFKEK